MMALTPRHLTSWILCLALAGAAGLACAEERDVATSEDVQAAEGSADAPAPVPTGDAEVLRFIGERVAATLAPLGLSPAETAEVAAGFETALAGESGGLDPEVLTPRLEAFLIARQGRAAQQERDASAAFVAELAARPGAETTPSGLVYIETKAGDGAQPEAASQVRVHYHGTLRDGTVFDSSVDRGTPAEFPLDRVIACWQEGVAKMRVGGTATLVCPSSIAYGDRGSPPLIPGGAALKFDVELLEVVSP